MKIDGHRQRGDLPFGDDVIADAVNKEADFLFAQRLTVTFLTNDFLCQEQNVLLQYACAVLSKTPRTRRGESENQ